MSVLSSTDIFPDQLPTDQIDDQRQGGESTELKNKSFCIANYTHTVVGQQLGQ